MPPIGFHLNRRLQQWRREPSTTGRWAHHQLGAPRGGAVPGVPGDHCREGGAQRAGLTTPNNLLQPRADVRRGMNSGPEGSWRVTSVCARPNRCTCARTANLCGGRPAWLNVQIKACVSWNASLRLYHGWWSLRLRPRPGQSDQVYEPMRAGVPTASGTLRDAIGRRQKAAVHGSRVLGAKRAWWGRW